MTGMSHGRSIVSEPHAVKRPEPLGLADRLALPRRPGKLTTQWSPVLVDGP
jgi:hypothetical protein